MPECLRAFFSLPSPIAVSWVFFPMSGAKDGWAKLARDLDAEIDEDTIEPYRGTLSLPFEAGEYK